MKVRKMGMETVTRVECPWTRAIWPRAPQTAPRRQRLEKHFPMPNTVLKSLDIIYWCWCGPALWPWTACSIQWWHNSFGGCDCG